MKKYIITDKGIIMDALVALNNLSDDNVKMLVTILKEKRENE